MNRLIATILITFLYHPISQLYADTATQDYPSRKQEQPRPDIRTLVNQEHAKARQKREQQMNRRDPAEEPGCCDKNNRSNEP